MGYAMIRCAVLLLLVFSFQCSHTNQKTSSNSVRNDTIARISPQLLSAGAGSAEEDAAVDDPDGETGAADGVAAYPADRMESGRVCTDQDDCGENASGAVPVDVLEERQEGGTPSVSGEETASNEESPEERGQNILDSALEYINASQEYWSEGSFEKAIATLDEAYSLVIKVNTYSNPDLIQQQEDLRFMISKRILEIYASRYTAVNGNHDAIPMTMNEHVEKEIALFTGRERSFFVESYRRSGRYMPKILAALKEAGLPEQLAWLPLIESGFKVNALSRARALGLWQFIPSTGYKFGLKRDTWVDERLDPEKATAAAIAYLKELHQIFGDWTTVLAGYNCGEGTVLKKIRNQRINYLDNFWDLYEQLPRETARYVPRFLATLHILNDPAKYGFEFLESDSPASYETVTLEKPVRLKDVAAATGIDLDELTDLNPELRQKSTPPTRYTLKIPVGRQNVVMAHLDQIPHWIPPKNEYVYHRVRRGETLSTIALRYRTSVSSIARANNIRTKHFIRVGQRLKIPLRGSAASFARVSGEEIEYRVKKGDSLWVIARRFNTSTKSLQQINELESTSLNVGQILKIYQ